MLVLCRSCNLAVLPKTTKPKNYCNSRCWNKAYRDAKRPFPVKVKCCRCGTCYSKVRANQLYCGAYCREKARYENYLIRLGAKAEQRQKTSKCPMCKKVKRLLYAKRSKVFPFCTESCKIGYNTALAEIGKTYVPNKAADDSLYVKRWEILCRKAKKLPNLQKLLQLVEEESFK